MGQCPISKRLRAINLLSSLYEWDVLIRDEAQNHTLQEAYIDFLRGMFKGTEPSRYIALAYLTGILPIKKLKTQFSAQQF